MSPQQFCLLLMVSVSMGLSGCATYRNSSNIESSASPVLSHATEVVITPGVPEGQFTEIGPIEVSIKKLTAFNKDPTREQANEVLVEKAREIGADAVIRVRYESGIGMTTWGYMDANGTGVKMGNSPRREVVPKEAPAPQNISQAFEAQIAAGTDLVKRMKELNSLYKDRVISEKEYEAKKKQILDEM